MLTVLPYPPDGRAQAQTANPSTYRGAFASSRRAARLGTGDALRTQRGGRGHGPMIIIIFNHTFIGIAGTAEADSHYTYCINYSVFCGSLELRDDS